MHFFTVLSDLLSCSSRTSVRAQKRKKASHGLTPEQKSVQEAAWKKVDGETDMLIEQYEEMFGIILDADRAKELFPEYAATCETRRRYLTAVYEPAQQIVDTIFRRKISSRGVKGKVVVFTAGGPGAGKSSLIESTKDIPSDTLLIMDGTLAERVRAQENIELALKAGCVVMINYMHRPFRDAVNGVIDRALSNTSARAVPMRVVAVKHYGAMNTIINLYKTLRFNERFSIKFWKFVGVDRPLADSSISEVINSLPKSLDAFTREAYDLLDERYARTVAVKAQNFPKSVYEALRSQAPSFRKPIRAGR